MKHRGPGRCPGRRHTGVTAAELDHKTKAGLGGAAAGAGHDRGQREELAGGREYGVVDRAATCHLARRGAAGEPLVDFPTWTEGPSEDAAPKGEDLLPG